MKRTITALLFIAFLPLVNVQAKDKPAIWHLADSDTDLYILGSVHVLKPGTNWFDDDIASLTASSDAIYMELSAEDQTPTVMQPLVQKYGILPAGDTLHNYLPPPLYSELVTEFQSLGMPETQVNRFKPWTAATIYGALKFMKLGFTPESGVEATILAYAKKRGVTVKGLETAEYQITLFDTLPLATQVAFLEQTLKDKDRLQELMDTITGLWITGNTNGLLSVFDEAFADYPELEAKILTDRNKMWISSIANIMAQDGKYFMVVGAGHLVGDKSVVTLLQNAGAPVKRVR